MKRRVWISALAAICFLVVIGFWISKPAEEPISVRVMGQTNDLSGETWHIFEVTNLSQQSWRIACNIQVNATNRPECSVPARSLQTQGAFFTTLKPHAVASLAFQEPTDGRQRWQVHVGCRRLDGPCAFVYEQALKLKVRPWFEWIAPRRYIFGEERPSPQHQTF